MRKLVDFSGKRFGRWNVTSEYKYIGRNRYYLCACECGSRKWVRVNHISSEDTQSCGCLQRELATTHGMSRTSPEYLAWDGAIQRCTNPNHPGYKHYGGRGIVMCEEWMNDFTLFFQSLGSRPSLLHSLDRINNEGNYEPGNCRW